MRRYMDMFTELDQLRKVFETNLGEIRFNHRPGSRSTFLPGLGARQYPLINCSQDGEVVYVECLAPGIDPETLEISLSSNTVTISGQKVGCTDEACKESYHRSERATGKFVRNVELDTPVDEDAVQAEYKNGLLLLTLPKAEQVKPRKIAITAG